MDTTSWNHLQGDERFYCIYCLVSSRILCCSVFFSLAMDGACSICDAFRIDKPVGSSDILPPAGGNGLFRFRTPLSSLSAAVLATTLAVPAFRSTSILIEGCAADVSSAALGATRGALAAGPGYLTPTFSSSSLFY